MDLDRLYLYSQVFNVIEHTPPDWDGGVMGRSNLTNATIMLRHNLPEDLKMNTLLHEVIHMIVDMHSLKVGDDEPSINVIANGIFDFLRQNKDIAKRLCAL